MTDEALRKKFEQVESHPLFEVPPTDWPGPVVGELDPIHVVPYQHEENEQ